jgi:hypothetical protein
MTLLSQSTALLPGAELWILPQYEESSWTCTIDWMLNFIILKNLRHQRSQLQSEMLSFISETQFPVSQIETEHKNKDMLLILSDKLTPNRWIIHSPVHAKQRQELQDWVKQITLTAKSLKALSMRVFIPKSVGSTDFFQLFDQELKSLKYPVEITYVQEGQAT